MKKISKFLFVALVAPLLVGCNNLMPQFNTPSSVNYEEENKPNEQEEKQVYTISWVDWDGDVLEASPYKKGEWPTYHGAEPYREESEGISYTFSGWAPEIVPVVNDTTYIAQYNSVVKYEPEQPESDYVIAKFVNWNGDVLYEKEFLKGTVPSYNGITPRKAAEGDITYTFAGWSPAPSSIYQDTTYVATFTSNVNQTTSFTIRFVNYDGTVLKEATYEKGEYPRYVGVTPTRPNDGDVSYTFTGWTPAIEAVNGDATYVATYSASYNQSTYVIKFVNYDGTVLQSTEYQVGETPSYVGMTPTRPNDGDINYVFAGWTPTIEAVNGSATYVATFTSSYNQSTFTIKWVNWNGVVLETDTCAYGETPVYNGAEPSKPAENDTGYVFSGWSPVVVEVTGDATYVAQFDMSNENLEYAITWYNSDGSFLAQDYFKHGETPVYNHETPTRDPSVENTYAFVGWTPEITEVTRSASYKAVYEPATRQYEVRWLDVNDNLIYSEMVDYGAELSYQGATPTKESDQQYVWFFVGWSESRCNGNTNVYPRFVNSLREYTITWENFDGTVLKQDSVPYGNWPNYSGETPTRPAEGAYSYEFNGWSPYTNSVTGDATYTAQYYSRERWVTISYAKYNGDIFTTTSYLYGSDVSTSLDERALFEIARPGDADHYYEFVGWDKEITTATEDITLNPVFEERNCVDNLLLKASPDGSHYIVAGFKNIPSCKHIGIPSEYNGVPITEIGYGAFSGHSEIRRVVMSDSVTTVGGAAFQDLYSATITLSSNLTRIGDCAFGWNDSFTELDLENVETIGNGAFTQCRRIENIKLGPRLNQIGNNAFANCGSNFEVDKNNLYFKSIDGVLYSGDGLQLIAFPQKKDCDTFIVPSGVQVICEGAFSYSTFKNIVVPQTLIEIQYHAFFSSAIESIDLPESLETLADQVFEYCHSLQSVSFGSNITSFGIGMFNGCSSLQCATLPEGMTIIPSSTFCGCSSLCDVDIPSTITEISDNAFANCQSLEDITIPEGITVVGPWAFSYCNNLRTVTLPSSLTRIGYAAFMYCRSLENIVIPESVTFIDDCTFMYCQSLTSVVIPEGIQQVGNDLFIGCTCLDEVVLPSSIWHIGVIVFDGCYYLYEIHFNGTMAEWEAIEKEEDWKNNSGIQQIICSDGTITL